MNKEILLRRKTKNINSNCLSTYQGIDNGNSRAMTSSSQTINKKIEYEGLANL